MSCRWRQQNISSREVAIRAAVCLAALLLLSGVSAAHGSKSATMGVRANVVCTVNGDNKLKTKCKKSALVFQRILQPLEERGAKARAQTSDTGQPPGDPLIWTDSLQPPNRKPLSFWDFERDFTPVAPPAESEINVNF